METTNSPGPEAKSDERGFWPALIAGGVSCGVLDISAAFIDTAIQSGAPPIRVLYAVASAVLGRSAMEGGYGVAALGLALHFGVAFSATLVFYALSRRVPWLVRHALPAGLLYGAAVYLFMNAVTLPFASWFRSLYLHTPVRGMPLLTWTGLGIHLAFVGLPIALAVRRFAR